MTLLTSFTGSVEQGSVAHCAAEARPNRGYVLAQERFPTVGWFGFMATCSGLIYGLMVYPAQASALDMAKEPTAPGVSSTQSRVLPSARVVSLDAAAPEPTRFSEAYTLSSGDRINVLIANVPEYSGVFQVLVDGTVDLPILGNVDVNGMTLSEASHAIAQHYASAEILVEPLVNVILAEANLVEVAITGEVNRPGVYVIAPDNGELPTLAEVIEKAGGITQQANLQHIEIHRAHRSGMEQTIEVSLWKLLTEGDISQNVSLRDGDRIALTPADAMDSATVLEMGNASFAASTVQVNVVGEVQQPGTLQVPPNTSLNQALLMSGGFNNRARRGSVSLIRLNPNGTVSQQQIEIDFSDDINDTTNPILRDRDVILVGRSTLAQISDTVGTILSPVGNAFSLFNLFSPFFGSSSP